VLPVGVGGVPGRGGVSSGVRTLRRAGGGAPVPLHLQRVFADSLQCHFGKEGSRTFGYDEALPGVFVSQPSPVYAQETQHPASALHGPQRVIP